MLKTKVLKDGIVCVWQGTVLKETEEIDFIEFIKSLGAEEVKVLGTIITKGDQGDENETTGGRQDLFFEVTYKDISFPIKRLKAGIRWLEDVLSDINGYKDNPIYPEYIKDYL